MRYAYIMTSTKEQDGQGQRNSILEYHSSMGINIDNCVFEAGSSIIHQEEMSVELLGVLTVSSKWKSIRFFYYLRFFCGKHSIKSTL